MPLITLKKSLRLLWIDDDIMKLIREKKRLWKRIKSNESAELFDKCKALIANPKLLSDLYVSACSENLI